MFWAVKATFWVLVFAVLGPYVLEMIFALFRLIFIREIRIGNSSTQRREAHNFVCTPAPPRLEAGDRPGISSQTVRKEIEELLKEV